MTERRRLAVLGSPIAHSLSPAIHAAAYEVLGLDWEYGRAEVREGGLAEFVAGLGPEWRGLSLTMPLKREAPGVAAWAGALVGELGQANTLVIADDGIRAYSTDAAGIIGALAEAGTTAASRATVLGGGATAESAVVALRAIGAEVTVAARSPERAARLVDRAQVVPLADAPMDADVVISTVPAGADLPAGIPDRPQLLLDVIYSPWPTPLAAAWLAGGGRIVGGRQMLLHQALGQVRAFTGGDPATPLTDEEPVLRAMRGAVRGS